MPWIRGEQLPTLRKWCEMELIRLAVFSAIREAGVLCLNQGARDVGTRRLVDDFRKLAMSQLVLERALLMTPAAKAQLADSKESPLDLVAMMARANAAETVEPEQPAESSSRNPTPDSGSATLNVTNYVKLLAWTPAKN
jgi:hypothetical protein